MNNIQLLFSENVGPSRKIRISNKHVAICSIDNSDGYWTGKEIKKMIFFVNQFLIQYSAIKIPVFFLLEGVTFIDKLTYIIFECICEYLIELGYPVQVFMQVKREIGIEGIESSPLLLLNDTKQ